MPTCLRIALLCMASSVLSSCASPDSPEAQVRKLIDQMEIAAEARDTSDLMALVSGDFRDAYGQNAAGLSRYIRGYFIANQSIHLLTRVEQIDFPHPDEARARITVAMVGRDADAAAAWNLAADLHEFDLTLRKEGGEWKVGYVEWERN